MSSGEPDKGPEELAHAITMALGRPWTDLEPRPTFERLTHWGFCAECEEKNKEGRRCRREAREQVPGCRIVRDPAWTVPTYRDVAEAFALELRNARRAAGLSQAAVARRLGRRQTFLSKLEAGERRLSLVDVVEIAAVMDLDLAKFMSMVRSAWWRRVYRHVQPAFEVKSASDEDGEPADEPLAPTEPGEPADEPLAPTEPGEPVDGPLAPTEPGEPVDGPPDIMAGQPRLWK